MTNTKTVETKVTFADYTAAQGGHCPIGSVALVWVECPSDYDAAKITASDVVNDGQIRVVDEPEAA